MNNAPWRTNGVKFCETPTALQILNVLITSTDAAHLGIGLIVGPSGVGKTTTIRHFVSERELVHVVTMNETTRTMKPALSHICKSLMGYDAARTSDMSEMIVRFLGSSSLCLIIDEANELDDSVVNQLRHIYDDTPDIDGNQCGLVLCGNAEFRNRFGKDKSSAFAQVTGRLGVQLNLDGPTEEDVEALCDFHSIAGSAERKFILNCSKTAGALRFVNKVIAAATNRAKLDGKPIDVEHLKSVASNFM